MKQTKQVIEIETYNRFNNQNISIIILEDLMKIEDKLNVLLEIGNILNKAGVRWAVGGSLLLYLKGISNQFNDIDIMVLKDDVDKVNDLFSNNDSFKVNGPNDQFKTFFYCELVIDSVDIDIMAGFAIVYNNEVHDCSLTSEGIVEKILINNVEIPLQSVHDWRRYYVLMERKDKVEMIDLHS